MESLERSRVTGGEGVSLHLALLSLWTLALAASAYHSYDRFTWILEVFPAVLGIGLLILAYRRFRLTNLLYVLIFIHSLILMLGGHYSYARVPLGVWMEGVFGFTRNNYDRIGHFAQGFVPAIIARELFLRHKVMRRGAWMVTVIILVCLGISAIYELFEWRTAVFFGSAAESFLGTQGDPWDTQEDMFMAGVGASVALLLLSRVHDRALLRLPFPRSGAE
jgi:putative membrane protein